MLISINYNLFFILTTKLTNLSVIIHQFNSIFCHFFYLIVSHLITFILATLSYIYSTIILIFIIILFNKFILIGFFICYIVKRCSLIMRFTFIFICIHVNLICCIKLIHVVVLFVIFTVS